MIEDEVNLQHQQRNYEDIATELKTSSLPALISRKRFTFPDTLKFTQKTLKCRKTSHNKSCKFGRWSPLPRIFCFWSNRMVLLDNTRGLSDWCRIRMNLEKTCQASGWSITGYNSVSSPIILEVRYLQPIPVAQGAGDVVSVLTSKGSLGLPNWWPQLTPLTIGLEIQSKEAKHPWNSINWNIKIIVGVYI